MNKGKRAIVLGAGASCSYIDSPTKQRPPLANQILPTYFKLEIASNRHVLIGNIIEYVRRTRGISHDEFSSWNDDVEIFLTEIDEEINRLANIVKSRELIEEEFHSFNSSQGTYNQLIFLFASILNEIQNGPVSIPYALLANELTDDDTCLTFNWDTLFDRALASTGKWTPINGYSIKPESIFDDGWSTVDNYQNNSGVQYLKLHGSTNWLTPYNYVNLSTGNKDTMSGYAADKLFVYVKATTPYKTYENRYWGLYEPYSYCYYPPDLPCERDNITPGFVSTRHIFAPDLPEHAKFFVNEKDVYSMPLIVPPVRNKKYFRYGKVFSELWGQASIALSECEELFVIGYSFPSTDSLAKELFRDALKVNKNLRRVVIWNPHPSAVEAVFLDDFGINKDKLHVKTERFNPASDPTSRILS